MSNFSGDTYVSSPHLDPDSQCIYYNATNKKFLIDAYEGIPQNLLLNFIAWLLLLVLFTILRKRAGNYGRLALVQRPANNVEWTDIFFGGTDDVTRAAPNNDSGSMSSLDSAIYTDRGAFSWLIAVFSISATEIARKSGRDAAQYLSFQKHIIFFMAIMMCISLVIVLPSNFQGHLQGDENTFGHTTLSNLDPESPLLWIHVTLSILYLPLAIIIMRRFSVHARVHDTMQESSKTVMITNVPRKYGDQAKLKRYFRETHPDLTVLDIQLVFDVRKVSKIKKELDKVIDAKKYCEDYLRNHDIRLEVNPHLCRYGCPLCGCHKVDGIEFYTNEEERLYIEHDRALSQTRKQHLGIAFVTMETVEDAEALENEFKRAWICGTRPSNSSLSGELKPEKWVVSFAPDKDDVIWENLSLSKYRYWYARYVIVNLMLFIVLFFLTTPAFIVNLMNTISFSEAIQSVNPVLSQFVPTVILCTVAAIMPVIVSYSDQFLSHWTRSEQNYSIMVKTFVFLLFMVLVLPAIGLTSAKAFVDWTWHFKNETDRWKCLFLPDKGAFFVNYVITSTFIGTSLELIRFSELFVYAIRLLLARSPAETSSVRKAILWEFPFGVQYAWMLLVFAMTTVFSLSCPLITPFGLLYMLFKHCVDKHNLFFAYSPSKISSEIHATAINCVVFSVVLVQACFLGLSVIRSGWNPITCFALAGFCLTILFFLFMVFFSCCEGFSPISYKRRTEDTLQGSPSKEPASQWYVPDVLNIQNAGTDEATDVPRSYGTQAPDVTLRPHSTSVLYQTPTDA